MIALGGLNKDEIKTIELGHRWPNMISTRERMTLGRRSPSKALA